MTPEDALQLIDNALSQLQLNREGHVKIQQAVAVLKQAIEPKKEPEIEQ